MQLHSGVRHAAPTQQRFAARPGTRTYTQDTAKLLQDGHEQAVVSQLWHLPEDDFRRAKAQVPEEETLGGRLFRIQDSTFRRLNELFDYLGEHRQKEKKAAAKKRNP